MRHILRFTLFGTCILIIYLLFGCQAVPITVTSNPPGAAVYVAERSGSLKLVGYTPSARVQAFQYIKVVWSDGVESNIRKGWDLSGIIHFEKPQEDHQINVAAKQSGQVNAPWGPIQVVSYTFDTRTQKGSLSVDISERGFEVRDWVVKNIGKICSTQNIGLEAGKEPTTGGRYKILNESVKNSILTIEFEALY